MASDIVKTMVDDVREILGEYGRDYAIGAIRGLAARNLVEVSVPERTEGFYPIVKVHEMALRDIEEVFYSCLQAGDGEVSREDLIRALVDGEVWG